MPCCRHKSGHFLNLFYLITTVWTSLLGVDSDRSISSTAAWIALLVYCALAVLLVRKVRAYEVVK